MNIIQRNKLDIMKLRARGLPTKLVAEWKEENHLLKQQLNHMTDTLNTVANQRDEAIKQHSEIFKLYANKTLGSLKSLPE